MDALRRLSPDRPDVTVLVPESFRGGCSVGAEDENVSLRSLPQRHVDGEKLWAASIAGKGKFPPSAAVVLCSAIDLTRSRYDVASEGGEGAIES